MMLERGAAVLKAVERMANRSWAVPDFELLFGVSDNAGLPEGAEMRAPTGAMCMTRRSPVLPIPDMGFYQWRDLGEGLGHLTYPDSIAEAFRAGAAVPYASRNKTNWFRGSCHPQRVEAAALALLHPDVLDIHCGSDVDLPSAPFVRAAHFAVVSNFKGNGYSARSRWLMALGSPMVFMEPADSQLEFFWPLLRPFVEYWPVRTADELLNATRYLLAHPDVAEAVGRAGAEFVRTRLSPDEIDCVWAYYGFKLAEVAREPVALHPHARAITGLDFKTLEETIYSTNWGPTPVPPPPKQK